MITRWSYRGHGSQRSLTTARAETRALQRKFQFDMTSCAGVRAVCCDVHGGIWTCWHEPNYPLGFPHTASSSTTPCHSCTVLLRPWSPVPALTPLHLPPPLPPFSYISLFFPLRRATVPVLFEMTFFSLLFRELMPGHISETLTK